MSDVVLPFPPASLSGHAKGHWSPAEIAWLRQVYGRISVAEIAQSLGRTKGAIRNRAYALQITVRDDNWTASEIEQLRSAYAGATLRGDLRSFTQNLGRSKSAISTKAAQLGLSDRNRPVIEPGGVRTCKPKKYQTAEERSEAASDRLRDRHLRTPHPMKGKRHSPEVREKISAKSVAAWKSKSDVERADWANAILRSRLDSQGTLAPRARPHGSWKAGWREIGGQRAYFRSRWEANYARYLQWLKERHEIADWRHEPETFWFEAIKRGVRSYLPDFRVFESDGSSKLHEVKGWMDSRSKTTLRRMAKYHPSETIILIRERDYNAIARQLGRLIEGWEHSDRSDRP